MSEQAEALAQQFEQANDEAIRVVEVCPEGKWHTHHHGENCSANVLAHHIDVGHQIITDSKRPNARG
jgi:hypothetical protein